MARILAALALILAGFAILAEAGARRQVDVALVLAVDCSGSVDEQELRLQLDGIAAAFRNPEIIAAALSGARGRVAVNLLNWSDAEYEKFATGWFEIGSPSEAYAFAAIVKTFDKRASGGTGIGMAIAYGIALIEASGFEASRKVIDISGDGIESWENRIPKITVESAQHLRRAANVTVNGLAIRNDFQFLDRYYRDFVIGGPGSFAMDVADYRSFGDAIRLKLLRELRPLTAKTSPPPTMGRKNMSNKIKL